MNKTDSVDSAPAQSNSVPVWLRRRGTLYATFPRALALNNEDNVTATLGAIVFSCDYNGWADVPEEEREGIDAFEASAPEPVAVPAALVLLRPTVPPQAPARKAA